ncbi:glycerophosphodiester phosphodiesterase [Lactococcus fujiensis]|uniref:Glycerophosphodiester phosphodiesterase n=1 Tax=Lactococcus fujiensis JCM 16395 TaxID=1291764 RepID=A0A2A5RLQ9_9LACT|nr:glycerophosphodiester phosphodiesterase [Lactococcus fujiensis]PCS00232.1 glycerophosphodiester phosphodiesterase [Lactococcus fujiensis JCM 16395]
MVVGLTNLINGIRRNIDRRKAARAEKWIQLHQPANHEIETLVYAHRGSKCNRPENTLASFNEAIRIGTDGIELDVHLTADNQLVVIHDEKIDRTTNGKGLVQKLTLAQLKRYDAGSWFAPEFTGERIPTLFEVLSLLTSLDFTGILNIEVKTDKYQYPNIEKILSDMMTGTNWSFDYLYSSFNIDTLKNLSKLEPDTEMSFLTENSIKKIEIGLLEDFVISIHPRKTYAFKHPVLASRSSKPIRIWTVNSDKEIRLAFQENIAGIITDYPEKAIQIRNEIMNS